MITSAWGGVVINEFAYYLDPAGDTGKEWIELYNPDSVAIDLSGYDIYPGRSPHYLVPQGFILEPHSFVLVHLRMNGINTATDLYEGMAPTSNMPNTKGSLALFADSTRDSIVDFVQYGAAGQTYETTAANALIWTRGDFADTVTCGWSLGLSSDGADNNLSSDWSGHSKPTPGYSNDSQPYDLALISVSTDPLEILAEAGFRVTARLQNQGLSTARHVAIIFFEDSNRDSVCQAGESVLYSQIWDSLPGEAACSFSVSGRPEGSYELSARADCDSETVTLNNCIRMAYNIGSPVVINEIMYAPPVGQPEWLELFNRSSRPVAIGHWTIEDGTALPKALSSGQDTMLPGTYALLSLDTAWFYADCVKAAVAGWPSLNNTGDICCLRDSRSAVIDKVQFSGSWGGGEGLSLERINPFLGSQDASAWGGCVAASGGTPGYKNSIFIDKVSSAAGLYATPNPFSPDGDRYQDETLITYDLPWTRSLISLRIYDRAGRLVKTLSDRKESGATGMAIWNGRDQSNLLCSVGPYIVLLEAKDYASSDSIKKKLLLVVARKL